MYYDLLRDNACLDGGILRNWRSHKRARSNCNNNNKVLTFQQIMDSKGVHLGKRTQSTINREVMYL
jgi:hypothetical protein